jgi:hypothetical protein
VSQSDDLAMARWEVATLTGRLRWLEAERDAALEERERHQRQAAALRDSRSYRLGQAMVELTHHPMGIAGRAVRRLRHGPATPPRRLPPVGPAPALVYVAVGLDGAASHALVRALRQRIVVDGDHLPVLVTDQPELRGMQVPGVVLEYLPDPETWRRHDPGADWEAMLAERIAQLCRDHRAAGTVLIDPRDPPTLARLLSN